MTLVVLLALTGCFGGGSEGDASDGSETGGVSQAMSKMEKMDKKMKDQKNKTVEPVNFRKLRKLLPEKAVGLKRTDMEGQTGGAMGMNISTTEATYEGGKNRRVEVKITDMGAMSGFGALGYGWTMMNIDKETSSGYEKTTQHKGYKAHEKYNHDRQRGKMQVLIADRFVVEVTGRDVEMETVRNILGQIDLSALEAMKDEGEHED